LFGSTPGAAGSVRKGDLQMGPWLTLLRRSLLVVVAIVSKRHKELAES